MNKRERYLIIVLAAAIILMGGFKFLIQPSLTNLETKSTEFLKAIQDKKTSQDNILRANSIDTENKKLEASIATAVSPFFPELRNDIIQIWVQGLADKSMISINVLNMSQPVVAQITNPVFENKAITYPAKDFADTINSIKSGSSLPAINGTDSNASKSAPNAAQNKLPNDLIEMMTVTIQFNGSYEQAMSFLNEIKNSKRIVRVTSLNILKSDKPELDINIVLECFGVKKFTEGDVLSKNTLPAPAGKSNPFS
jgi:Tfp pilus assembly protein PilO